MSLIDFKLGLLDQLLTFLWRQWSQLGVLGEAGTEDDWVLDPESLLVFSLQMARYEPRLFDEILGWLVVNGSRLDASRLKSIVKRYGFEEARVVGAVLQFLIRHADKRKWATLAAFCAQLWRKLPQSEFIDSLFRRKHDGVPYPLVGLKEKEDQDFLLFRLDRPQIPTMKEPLEPSMNARTNLRLMLRSLFGIGSRSECLAYLLTHDGGEPRVIADEIGLYWLGVQQTLADMADSGLVSVRSKGKRKIEYWISHKRWWDFLAYSGQEIAQPKWLNWSAIYSALWGLWQTVDDLCRGSQSDYMKASKLHDSLEVLEREFTRAGYDLPRIPPAGAPPDLYQKTALQFLGQIFKVPLATPSPLSATGALADPPSRSGGVGEGKDGGQL
jgi:hypothetical protein